MQFIKRKNLQEGEELLYLPQIHWFYTVRHMALSLPLFLVLFILWLNAVSFVSIIETYLFQMIIRNVFMAAALMILLDFVWRIFVYLSTEYGITNKRLLFRQGLFRLTAGEIPVDRIESMCVIQGIFGRIFHYGKIAVTGIGGTKTAFYMACRPYAIRRKIAEIIEKNKAITVIHGDLPGTQPGEGQEPSMDEEAFYRYGTFIRVLPKDSEPVSKLG